MEKGYDFTDRYGNISLCKLASARQSPNDPRYIPPELVEALFRLKIAQMNQQSEKNVALLEEAAALKVAKSAGGDKEGADS
jgi:hypothetical protein